jgi:opacity protein-like surface antigen
MRRLLAALGLIVAISDASAGEIAFPTLRGSNGFVPETPTYLRWSGIYAGGHVGYGYSSMDFREATQSLIAFSLRELALESEQHPSTWQVLGKSDTKGVSAGGFVGYNVRFDETVLGLDFNYSRASFYSAAPMTPISRLTSANGNTYGVTITGDASLRITDIATLRARAGYAVDNWLPYATIGVAVGRVDFTRTATVSGEENPAAICPSPGPPACTPFSFTESEAKSGAVIYGWSVGGGIDVMAMPNVFVRAEYEFVNFGRIAEIRAVTSLGRLGIGFKF